MFEEDSSLENPRAIFVVSDTQRCVGRETTEEAGATPPWKRRPAGEALVPQRQSLIWQACNVLEEAQASHPSGFQRF